MNSLPVPSFGASSIVRNKALQDARLRQKEILALTEKLGIPPPNYALLELIGKGSYGRVYKGRQLANGEVVAIKIINVDDDYKAERGSDAYSDFMKEVNALKIMSETKARNINHVIEAFPLGSFMFMISQYCGGGSVVTLMRPTPGGLKETYIVPVLREVAIALQFVHEAGLIHRDVKCANVLITEEGQVQLCDFGVAGIVESKVDKRMTVIGTPNWMAPELWEGNYGKEVDIWAYASLAYEMATGVPPNAGLGMEMLGQHLKEHMPRLEGDKYSHELKDLIARCLVPDAKARLTAIELQNHKYLFGTEKSHPTSSLVELIKAFKKWEEYGGSRKSLFWVGGAAAPEDPSEAPPVDDNWNFSTTDDFDEGTVDTQDIIKVYGRSVNLDPAWEESKKPVQRGNGRRRPPPEALAAMKAPIERLFDPNTITSYNQSSQNQYGRRGTSQSENDTPRPASQPDPSHAPAELPFRADFPQPVTIRESVIDLGDHDTETGISTFHSMDTLKPLRGAVDDISSDFLRPALSDPADINKRATVEWKFPSMATPSSADAESFRFPPLQPPQITPAAGGRPQLRHHPTEPIAVPSQSMLSPPSPTGSRMSLIDLDFSMPDELAYTMPTNLILADQIQRPSTGDSTMSDLASHPFQWESHISLQPNVVSHERTPSLLLPTDHDDSNVITNNLSDLNRMLDMSELSASEYEATDGYDTEDQQNYQSSYESDYPRQSALPLPLSLGSGRVPAGLPELPPGPSVAAMTGSASNDELAEEVRKMLSACTDQLAAFQSLYEPLVIARHTGNSGI